MTYLRHRSDQFHSLLKSLPTLFLVKSKPIAMACRTAHTDLLAWWAPLKPPVCIPAWHGTDSDSSWKSWFSCHLLQKITLYSSSPGDRCPSSPILFTYIVLNYITVIYVPISPLGCEFFEDSNISYWFQELTECLYPLVCVCTHIMAFRAGGSKMERKNLSRIGRNKC